MSVRLSFEQRRVRFLADELFGKRIRHDEYLRNKKGD